MSRMAATMKNLTLEISGEDDSLTNTINFSEAETVGGVLGKIRAQLDLKPNEQIILKSFRGLEQESERGELLAHERMSKHFPEGGTVRIDTQASAQDEADMTIDGNVADDEAQQHNIVAIQSEKGERAKITNNRALQKAKMMNIATNDTKSFFDKIDLNFH